MNKKISIKKIAELSGVSVATVSRVINNNGRFSEETRKKVLKVIRENNYQTNNVAKSLRMHKSYTVGILVPDITNPFFSNTVQIIEKNLFEKGYSTIICNTARSRDKELEYVKILESKIIDGLIVISGFKTFDRKNLPDDLPVICIDRSPADSTIAFVGSDHYEGAVMATEFLLAETENLAIVKHDEQSSSGSERVRGFEETLFKEKVEKFGSLIVSNGSQNDQQKQIKKFLQDEMNGSKQPLGVFALSDTLAANILLVAHDLSIKVPKQLKIMGFDDSPIASYCSPQLTTIRQNEILLAKEASGKLIKLMNGENLARDEIVKKIPVQLIVRGTT